MDLVRERRDLDVANPCLLRYRLNNRPSRRGRPQEGPFLPGQISGLDSRTRVPAVK
jgi:hypothetical protein